MFDFTGRKYVVDFEEIDKYLSDKECAALIIILEKLTANRDKAGHHREFYYCINNGDPNFNKVMTFLKQENIFDAEKTVLESARKAANAVKEMHPELTDILDTVMKDMDHIAKVVTNNPEGMMSDADIDDLLARIRPNKEDNNGKE